MKSEGNVRLIMVYPIGFFLAGFGSLTGFLSDRFFLFFLQQSFNYNLLKILMNYFWGDDSISGGTKTPPPCPQERGSSDFIPNHNLFFNDNNLAWTSANWCVIMFFLSCNWDLKNINDQDNISIVNRSCTCLLLVEVSLILLYLVRSSFLVMESSRKQLFRFFSWSVPYRNPHVSKIYTFILLTIHI